MNNYILGLSLNYPGVGVKFFIKRNLLELRYQIIGDEGQQSNLLGLRYYRQFYNKNLYYYIGLETSFFDTMIKPESLRSSGYIVGSFLGIEKFLYKNFSFNLDFGPYIAQATIYDTIATEFDFVVNMSINLYFLRKK
ncbi:MAG: hypothetical protein ACK4WJ_00290 [Endomicrobiia bacterium]